MSDPLARLAALATTVVIAAWLVLVIGVAGGAALVATSATTAARPTAAGAIGGAAGSAGGATPAVARATVELAPRPRTTPLRVTATPAPPVAAGTATLVPAVDWPELPDLTGRSPLDQTDHFAIHAEPPADPLLQETAVRWVAELEPIYDQVRRRLGRDLVAAPVQVVFARSYGGRCPARGLAAPLNDPPLLMVFVDEQTSAAQVRAVLAHEMAHHLTLTEDFVGDGVLTEGIANWAADSLMLAWQGYPSWDAAVRDYLAEGDYVSIADDTALNPRPGERCLVRRDRIYNIRTAFVDWLVRRLGLAAVLAMPPVEVELPPPDPNGSEPERLRVPDYPAATGQDLKTLEMLWLQELRATPWPAP